MSMNVGWPKALEMEGELSIKIGVAVRATTNTKVATWTMIVVTSLPMDVPFIIGVFSGFNSIWSLPCFKYMETLETRKAIKYPIKARGYPKLLLKKAFMSIPL